MKFILLNPEKIKYLDGDSYTQTYKIIDELTDEEFIIKSGNSSRFIEYININKSCFFRIMKKRKETFGCNTDLYKARLVLTSEKDILKLRYPEHFI